MKVLITIPDLSITGGVSSLFNILKMSHISGVDYFFVTENGEVGGILRFKKLVYKFCYFYLKIVKYDLLHVNPSLNSKSFFRDAVFVLLALIHKKKVLVYWHGWQDDFEQTIKKNWLKKWVFNRTFKRANTSIVLGAVFRDKLISLGVVNTIILESNAADDYYLKLSGGGKETLLENETFTLLFLARVVKEKGIYIAIDAFKELKRKLSKPIQLIIAGDGNELGKAKAYVKDNNIDNIIFKGHVSEEAKHEVYCVSDILLFPSYYNEGMPLVILEGMIYGLPIITRPIGGIPDWVIDGENGFLINSLNSDDYIRPIIRLLEDDNFYKKISNNNYQKAKENFTPDKVRDRLVKYYKSLA
ncbi:glycosyltransferase family 4 protein [Adhaeribacter swui]|uniref:Glycosyltransferase family 4 protein n=1 Tax=Adhaeribacter swui TaxID=2086471 RepID=A0A7G7G594_9BACT|nr:glycosyltransferase family 4 protein [Adhaeribacter swui]QNF32328.1 glycosyltransferase family 4 protein [Adhaeribacter swui]